METARRRGGMRSYGRVPTVKEFVMEVGTCRDFFSNLTTHYLKFISLTNSNSRRIGPVRE